MAMSTALRRTAASTAPRRAARTLAVRAFNQAPEATQQPAPAAVERKADDVPTPAVPPSERQLAFRRAPLMLETVPMRRMVNTMAAMEREMDAMLGGFSPFFRPRRTSLFALLDALTSDLMPARPSAPSAVSAPSDALRWNRIVPLEVQEDEQQYTLRAEVPGFSKNDIKVTLDPSTNVVTISGEVKHKQDPAPEAEAAKSEEGAKRVKPAGPVVRSYMSFMRRFALPEDVDTDAELRATTTDGVFTLTLPKVAPQPAPEPKTIPVH